MTTDRQIYIKRVYEVPTYPDGQIQDPDGIGEFEDEWTVEEMYKDMFDTVCDS